MYSRFLTQPLHEAEVVSELSTINSIFFTMEQFNEVFRSTRGSVHLTIIIIIIIMCLILYIDLNEVFLVTSGLYKS